jgi:hypothetical protein
MIRFERTTDFAVVKRIMTDPALYDSLSDDFYPAADAFFPNESPAVHYLLVFDGDEALGGLGAKAPLGLFIAHPINFILWECHIALLPAGRVRARARRVTDAFEEFMFEMTPALVLVGFVPACNPRALAFALRQGWGEAGRVPRGYQKRGVRHDLVVLSKSKPEKPEETKD